VKSGSLNLWLDLGAARSGPLCCPLYCVVV
jgi:hypothetical protein